MSTINITNARQNLFQLVSDVNVGFNPITIVNNKGKNAVLISEDEWKNIEETLYLSSIPEYVDDIKKIDDIINLNNDIKLLCTLKEKPISINNYLPNQIKDILFAIGPEGGFTDEEEQKLLNNGFKPVSLGKRVMRVETAAIYVASIINYIYEG